MWIVCYYDKHMVEAKWVGGPNIYSLTSYKQIHKFPYKLTLILISVFPSPLCKNLKIVIRKKPTHTDSCIGLRNARREHVFRK